MMKRVRKTTLALSVSVALFLAAGTPVGAETDLTIENDGMMLTAGAISAEQVLSIKLRISGPNGFEYEERREDSLIQWMPEGELADGSYKWEAVAVTVQPGAPMLDLAPPAASAVDLQAPAQGLDNAGHTIGGPDPKAARAQVPVERFYAEEFKSVERQSGSFQVRDGFILPAEPGGDELSDVSEPGLLGRMAGAVIDFVFPSAHAAPCASPCTVDSTGTAELRLRSDTDANSGGIWDWEFEVGSTDGEIRLGELSGTQEPLKINYNAPADSFFIDNVGDIGFGTATPTEPLHIADPIPRIRLEDTTGATDWWIRADGSGNDFEVGRSATADAPFTIDVGAAADSVYIGTGGQVGIGTRTPAADLHVEGTNLKIANVGSDWNLNPGGAGFWFTRITPTNAGGVVKIQNTAFSNSLVLNDLGAGFGTAIPEESLHIERSNNAKLLVENTTGTQGQRNLFELRNAGKTRFVIENTGNGIWTFDNAGATFDISRAGTGLAEFQVFTNGNARLQNGEMLAQGFTVISSREAKTDFAAVDSESMLDKVSQLEISEWHYKADEAAKRHIGPVAEDFAEIFGIGDGKTISVSDTAGIAFAAIQGLREEVQTKDQRIEELEARDAELRSELAELRAMIEQLQ